MLQIIIEKIVFLKYVGLFLSLQQFSLHVCSWGICYWYIKMYVKTYYNNILSIEKLRNQLYKVAC